jgi:hypothetical protein
MKFICAHPAIDYYTWQVEVMINNFIKNGINPEDIHILCACRGSVPKIWLEIQEKNKPVNFFFYSDTRETQTYIPSVYFNMMKQHLKVHPELEKEVLFLHDSDIIFTRPVDFSSMTYDKIWYLSDTVGYIGTQYVLGKGEDQYKEMCKIVGLDPLIPKLMNSNSGGAQHIVKNTTYEYWDKVEKDSIKLYQYLSEREPLWKGEGYPIQKWTAGMWSLLWNAWLFGHETKVDKRLDFCWATDKIHRWEEAPIFHNAGVTVDRKDLFFKGAHINMHPYNSISLDGYSQEYCSYNYVKEIIETSKKTCLI